MVPQGQLAYYTPTPAASAPPMYQGPTFQFPQPPNIPYLPSASPASSSEPSMYGHPPHPAPCVGTPASVAPSCIYPSSTHHTNFAHNAGSEHEHTSTSFSNGGSLPCQWQGQDIPPSSSPPPPAYPPGFEPKQNNPCIPTSHPHPHPHPHPHVNALSQPHPHPPPYLHTCPPSYSHHHPSSQTACHPPMLFPTAQTVNLPMAHGFGASGTVIGVPVMGSPIYVDGTCAAPPPVTPHVQQPPQTLQPKYGQRPMSSETRQQSCKSTFHLTRYFRGNGLHVQIPSKGSRNVQQEAWQPSNAQTPRFGMKGHATSTFQDCNQRQVASTFDNICLSTERNHQLQVPLRKFSGTNGRQLPNTCRENQPLSTERFHFKTCPAKEFTSPKAQDVHVNGQQKLVLCQSSEHKGNLHCEVIGDRPDGQPLRFNAGLSSSLALACSEALLSSHVKCEETTCSPNGSGELVMEHQMGSATTLVDSKAAPLPSAKKTEGLNRWLQDRKNKYPTPANILRKAEERRKRVEMGEFANDRPKTRLQHIKGVFTKCYHRQERPRIDKKMKFQEQHIDNSQLANTHSRDEESNCERNDLAESCHSVNGSDMLQEAGPIESPPVQGEVSDLEKSIQDTDSQSILTSDEIVDQQNNIEKTPGPGNAFLFRRKRRKRICDRSISAAQRQKQLLFKILDRNIEKESSYLLQCCRFIVNNHFLQGFSPVNAKHFEWVGAGKPSAVNGSSTNVMQDCARQTEMSTLGANEFLTGKIATDTRDLAHDQGQEHALLGEDDCHDLNEPSLANVENALDDNVCGKDAQHALDDNVCGKDAQHASALPSEELSCSNTEQDLIENTQHAPALPLQEMSSSDKEHDLIAEGYNDSGSQNRFVNGSNHHKEAPFPWKHLDGYLYQKTTASGLASQHYDYIREQFCANGLIIDSKHSPLLHCSSNGLITDSKHGPLLHSSSNLDAQGITPFLWEHSNTDPHSHLPNHEMDTGELASGIGDNLLNDDDDIFQYMNFDAFETDSGICYV